MNQMNGGEGYRYIERVVAPSVVEFYTRTPQGHRVVRIFLDYTNPRIVAFNETNRKGSPLRSPATMFLKEINALLERARSLVQPKPKKD